MVRIRSLGVIESLPRSPNARDGGHPHLWFGKNTGIEAARRLWRIGVVVLTFRGWSSDGTGGSRGDVGLESR